MPAPRQFTKCLLVAISGIAALSFCSFKNGGKKPCPDGGVYKLIRSVGGMMPHTNTSPSPYFIAFRKGIEYSGPARDSFHKNGPYHIARGKTIFSGTTLSWFLEVAGERQIISVSGDTLWITGNHAEPVTSTFMRLR